MTSEEYEPLETQVATFEYVFYSKVFQIDTSISEIDDKSCKFPPHAIQYLKPKDIPNILNQKIENLSSTLNSLLNSIEEEDYCYCKSLVNKQKYIKTIVSPQWISKEQLLGDTSSLKSWKEVNSDKGDSFYTCFVYSLFMQFIIEKKPLDILIYDILNNFQENIKKNYPDISFTHTIFVLKELYDNHSQDIESTLLNFFNYYNIFHEFDRVMKLYLRYCIFTYLQKHFRKNYIYILNEGSEPFPKEFVFQILSKLFNITLHLNDFSLNSSKIKPISLLSSIQSLTNKKSNISVYNNFKDSIHLYILFYRNHYHIYSNQNYRCVNFIQNALTSDMTNITINHNEICNICKQKDNLNLLYQDECSRFVMCRVCLNNYVQKIMIQRTELYCERKRYNKELYLRPIYVNDKVAFRDFILSKVFTDGEPFQKSYLSYLLDTYTQICCCKCFKIILDTKVKQSDCGCVFHYDCYKNNLFDVIETYKTDSKDFYMRNTAEKDGKNEFTCEHCKKHYYDDISQYFSDEKMKAFINKIKKTFMSYCIGCGEEIGIKNENIKNKSKTNNDGFKCIIIGKNDLTQHNKFENVFHYLCGKCNAINSKINSGQKLIDRCFFCLNDHTIQYERLGYLTINISHK